MVSAIINPSETVSSGYTYWKPVGIFQVDICRLQPVDGVEMGLADCETLVNKVRTRIDAIAEVLQVGQVVDGEGVGLRPDVWSLVRHNVIVTGVVDGGGVV